MEDMTGEEARSTMRCIYDRGILNGGWFGVPITTTDEAKYAQARAITLREGVDVNDLPDKLVPSRRV